MLFKDYFTIKKPPTFQVVQVTLVLTRFSLETNIAISHVTVSELNQPDNPFNHVEQVEENE